MTLLTYIESENGKIKKAGLEVASYGKALADQLNYSTVALVFGVDDATILHNYGIEKILNVKSSISFEAELFADIIKQAAEKEQSNVIVLSNSANSKYLAPILSIKTNSGYASNAVELPKSISPFTIKKSVFSNKAFSYTEILTDKKIISLSNNAFGLVENIVNGIVEEFSPQEPKSNIEIKGTDKVNDKISIADAEIVVSAGRGLKGPENWGLIENLADVLGAATACSKPVSDLGWRPHSEHVGQTGKPVASNLYIAIGISGAIQHLAGVNSSKIKVVINTDPEAPFFKAADYGVVGDAFEVVPKLTEKLKAFKSQNI